MGPAQPAKPGGVCKHGDFAQSVELVPANAVFIQRELLQRTAQSSGYHALARPAVDKLYSISRMARKNILHCAAVYPAPDYYRNRIMRQGNSVFPADIALYQHSGRSSRPRQRYQHGMPPFFSPYRLGHGAHCVGIRLRPELQPVFVLPEIRVGGTVFRREKLAVMHSALYQRFALLCGKRL